MPSPAIIRPLYLLLALALTSSLLTACGKNPGIALPADKQSLLGVWIATQSEFDNDVTSDNMLLVFHRNNQVSYLRCINRLNGHSYTNLPDAKLVRITDDEFEIAKDFFITDFNKTFIIQRLPYQTNGEWRLTVNGVSLRKLKAGEKSDHKNWQCGKNGEDNSVGFSKSF